MSDHVRMSGHDTPETVFETKFLSYNKIYDFWQKFNNFYLYSSLHLVQPK